ncbi:MAG: hypothetical protein FJ279_31150, partial [Planctomycetes bacterium]|nr:hypothetical protein [Planctomycetota bacterium]
MLLAEHDGQQLASADELSVGRYRAEHAGSQTVFFTDRALYRPGQTIYYKGIHLRYDQAANDYQTLAGERVTVEFLDPNGKEIARATHRCNDYGSFDGAFTAPRDRVTGRMTIRHLYRGATSFNVEEYKRPKFQVELSSPKESAKLNAEVVVTGKATAYTGAAIGGAKVKWRVVREVRFPVWCWWGWWRFGPSGQQSQAIAHGAALTENDGSFTVKFVAKPDLAVPEKDEPTFAFHVYADVTDTTGETRSDERVVRAGYTALQASLTANDWQTPDKPVEFTVDTKSLDGDPQPAEGTLKVYRLKQPSQVVRAELQPDRRWYWRSAAKQAEPKPDPADPNSWELDMVAAEKRFKTDDKGTAKVSVDLQAGIYRAMLETRDRFGKPVSARLGVHVVNPKATHFATKLANHFAAPKWELEPGESFVALWGTGYDAGRAFVEVEHRGKLLRGYWTGADRTQEVVEQAVTEHMRGGFTVRVTYVRENRAYLNERIVEVPWSNKQLAVKWEHFTSKLGPGKKETWTAVITRRGDGAVGQWGNGKKPGPNTPAPQHPNTPTIAEMVAALYDASLDQYKPHDWVRAFRVFRREVDRVNAQFQNQALPFQHLHGWWRPESRYVDLRYRSFPPDIVANLWGYGYFGPKKDGMEAKRAMPMEAPAAAAVPAKTVLMTESLVPGWAEGKAAMGAGQPPPAPGPDLSKVAARKNLNETAFFFPHLLSDRDGVVRIEF